MPRESLHERRIRELREALSVSERERLSRASFFTLAETVAWPEEEPVGDFWDPRGDR